MAGQTVDRLQLTAQTAHGHQIEKGFSGTGLFDTETGAVIGLVVTRDKGKDVLGGFAIPIHAVAASFPQLGPWIGWRLGTDRFLRQHWRPRARGVYEDTTPGWYFTGRTALLKELTGWLEHGQPDRAVRVVTGPAGTGKSAVLAWLCAVSDPQMRAEIAAVDPALANAITVPAAGRVSAALWARGLDAEGAAGALAQQLTLPLPVGAPVEDVLAAIRDIGRHEQGGLVVVLDALDEAKAPRDIARRVLVPLASNLGVKVLAGTRPSRDDELLIALGERALVYWLDDPAWFNHHDLAQYAAACLRADFDQHLDSGYRTEPDACSRIAEAIADAAGSNFLVAGLSARARADEPVIDVSAPGWQDRQRFPADVGQAFDDYLSRFGEREIQARDLLRAVAYAEGAGMPADATWADVATALAPPRRYGSDDLAWLLDSAAAYLIESGGEQGQPSYRIFHQALIEHLRPQSREKKRQREIASTLIAAVPRTASGPDWPHVHPYTRVHLATHAAAAGMLDGLVEDPGFLVTADPPGLLPALDAVRSPLAQQVAWFYRIAADRLRTTDLAERAAYLQLAAGKAGFSLMAAAFGAAATGWHWTAHVLSWRPPGRYTALGSTGPVRTSALTLTASGYGWMVTGDDDGLVALWRIGENELTTVGDPQPGHERGVLAATIGQVEGRLLAVTAGGAGEVRLWNIQDEGLLPVGDLKNSLSWNVILAMAVGQLGGQSVAVTGGDHGAVALWRLKNDGLVQVAGAQHGHDRSAVVYAIAVGHLGSRPVAVSLGSGSMQMWHVHDGGLLPVGNRHPGGDPGRGLAAVALGQLGDQAIALTGAGDGTVALWRLGHHGLAPLGKPQTSRGGRAAASSAVAIGQVRGQPVALTGASNGVVALWRLSEYGPIPLGQPEPGRSTAPVSAAAIGQLGGHPVAVTRGEDGTVALWRLNTDVLAPSDDVHPGHDDLLKGVQATAFGQFGGGPVAVTGGDDGTVALWRLSDDGLLLVGDPQHRHSVGRVSAVAVAQLGGGHVAVTGGEDGTVALWRLTDHGLTAVGHPLPRHGGGPEEIFTFGEVYGIAAGQLSSCPFAVSVKLRGMRLWRFGPDGIIPLTDLQTDEANTWTSAVAVGQLDGRPVAVTGRRDGTVWLWRVTTDRLIQIGHPQMGHGDAGVRAVTVGQLGGRPVAVTGGDDGTVALWQLSDKGLVSADGTRIPFGSPVVGIAIYHEAKVLVWCREGVSIVEMRNSQARAG